MPRAAELEWLLCVHCRLGADSSLSLGMLSLGTEIKTNVRAFLSSAVTERGAPSSETFLDLCVPGAGRIKVDGASSTDPVTLRSAELCTGCLKQDNKDGGAAFPPAGRKVLCNGAT